MEQVVSINRNNKRKRNIDPDARSVVFELLLKPSEKARLAAKAAEMGVSLSDLLRYGAFGVEGLRSDPKVDQVKDMLRPSQRAIGGVTGNINQIAERLNRLAKIGESPDEAEALDELTAVLVEMRRLREEMEAQINAIRKLV